RPLTAGTPLHLVLLDHEGAERAEDIDLGTLLSEAEVRIHDWTIGLLRKEHGEHWWTKGVPQAVRTQCVTRREEEGTSETVPPEAYLTLIDLRATLQKNWSACSAVLERIAEGAGKDKA